MIISGIVKSSLVDYPGIVACVLFVPGCNYNCFYCHNRSLIDGTHDVIDAKIVNDFLANRVGLLDGVVITGGEPTLQKNLIPYLKIIKDFGYKIKLDTNGSSPEVIEQLLKTGYCDYFAVDYKAPAKAYPEICGNQAYAGNVLTTINLLLENHENFEVRTTVIPQLKQDDLICMAQELPLVPRYVLNRYQAPEKYLSTDRIKIEQKSYTQLDIDAFAQVLRKYQPNTMS